jgi:hypothetical protein
MVDDRQARIKLSTINRLEKEREYQRETYDDIINKLLNELIDLRFEKTHPRNNNGKFTTSMEAQL